MKMDIESPTILRSKDFEEINFQIGDPIFIMEILRKQMYSNPIKSICQEIMANARDAHVEVGKSEVPIQVTLPTKEEPVWVCQDFGPGINPSRMIDVYIRFGCSTKRSSNSQVGGFGLGSKVIFSYTDSCLITTICNIEGHHIKFQYTAIIGESKALKLLQLHEPVGTEEPCGTTISINVARNDIATFINYSYQVTAYWDVRPEIIHPDESNQYNSTGKFVIEDGDFRIASRLHPFCSSPVILVDKVPYSIDSNIFRSLLKNEEYNFFFRNPCVLEFGNGELSISSNRETLYFDDKTKDKIIQKIKHYFTKTVDGINSNIEKFNSYKEATQYWNTIPDEIKHLSVFKWRDNVVAKTIDVPVGNEYFIKYITIIKYGKDNHIWKFKAVGELSVLGSEHILMSSTNRSYRDTIKYFQGKNEIDGNIYIIKIEHDIIKNAEKPQETLEMVNKNIEKYFSCLNPIPFENLPKRPSAEKITSVRESYKKTILYKFDSRNSFEPTPIENISDGDFNSIKYFVGVFGGRVISALDSSITRHSPAFESFKWSQVSSLLKSCKEIDEKSSLIGIQKDKFSKICDNWVYLADFLKEKIKKEREHYGLMNDNDFANYLVIPSRYGVTNLLSDESVKFILENEKKFNTMLVSLAKVVKVRRDSDRENAAISRIREKGYSGSFFSFIGSEHPKCQIFFKDEVDRLFPMLRVIQYPDTSTFPEVLEYLIQKSKTLKGIK